jgi:hypothetical protein
MSIELKIKSKHLALEPAIIRKEEKKLLKQIAWFNSYRMRAVENDPAFKQMKSKRESLYLHRVINVRHEARATYLARAYLAGIPYEKVESKRHEDHTFIFVILPRVYSMVAKYGPKKVQKQWNRDKKMYMYDEIEWKEFTSLINKWCNLE